MTDDHVQIVFGGNDVDIYTFDGVEYAYETTIDL